jgi:hypothetical protein
MDSRIPTRRGDVLILRTHNKSFSTHAVGFVEHDGQQDFNQHPLNVTYVTDGSVAVREATALVAPGRRIFFLNIDTGEWSVIAPA